MNYTRSQKKKYETILKESTDQFLDKIKQELASQKPTSSSASSFTTPDLDIHEQQPKLEKCPICLQKFSFKSKSYASTCFHSYCFECLLEWTKIRYSCPLCKQAFDRIIYDVKSTLEYKEHFLAPKTNDTLNYPLEIIAYLPPPNYVSDYAHQLANPNERRVNAEPVRSKASWFVNKEASPVEFRMLVYKNGWHVNRAQIQFDIKITNVELEFNDTRESNVKGTDGDSPTNANECECSSTSLNTTLYKHVTRFRNADPQWFRDNPATVHRLYNFLSREIHALSSLKKIDTSFKSR